MAVFQLVSGGPPVLLPAGYGLSTMQLLDFRM
jgi:hypothetical protein